MGGTTFLEDVDIQGRTWMTERGHVHPKYWRVVGAVPEAAGGERNIGRVDEEEKGKDLGTL